MHLSPRELDKLQLHQVGSLAQKRLARGVRLNHPEAIGLIATVILEFIRDGKLGKILESKQNMTNDWGIIEHLFEVKIAFQDILNNLAPNSAAFKILLCIMIGITFYLLNNLLWW